MIDYGIVKSTVKPPAKETDDFAVWLNSDIVAITETDGTDEFAGFAYHQVCYSKDEYIKLLSVQNIDLANQLTDMQVALCEVYELIGG